MTIEKRYAHGAKVEGRQLIGVAAPYGTETRINDFREVIAVGAFTRTLSEQRDILALADHDPTRVLGRTKSGTLALRETAQGLEYTLTLPDTSVGNDIRELAQRGDIGGVSMGFRAVRDSWSGDLRTLHEVELHEISIVSAHPAYADTTVTLRSLRPDAQRSLLHYWLETVR
ncbi:MAG TPA: HK97 family phage prohead protease [Luteimonas sp.]|nr:HK97 family phage prohead protease [Luteimonas sp.]